MINSSLLDPVHPTKKDTDNSYNSVMESAFRAVQKGRACIKIATHNPNSVKKALKLYVRVVW